MQIVGTVVTIENGVEIAKQAGGFYTGSRLAYRDESGALKEQCFHNNALKFNAAIKTALSNLSVGEKFTMVKEKEGEFWNVKSIKAGTDGSVPVSTSKGSTTSQAYTAPKSTYTTPEERAQTQVYIVRQHSITSAIAMLGSKAKNVEEVLTVAKQFEQHVYGNETLVSEESIHNIESDDID